MKKKNVSGGVKRERKRKRVLRANSLACCSLACLSVRLCPANIHTTRTEQHSTTHTHIHTQFRSRLARVEGAEGGGRETKGRKDDEDLNWFRCCVLLAATGTAAFPIIYHCSSSSLLGLHVCLSVRLLLHKVKATSYRPGLVRESRVSARVSIFCLGATGTVRLGDFHCRTLAGIAAASAAITMSVCPSLRARWSYESCSMGTKTRLVLYILHGYWCKRLVFVQSVRASVCVCVPGLAAPLLLPLASSRRPPKNDNSQAERQQEEGGGGREETRQRARAANPFAPMPFSCVCSTVKHVYTHTVARLSARLALGPGELSPSRQRTHRLQFISRLLMGRRRRRRRLQQTKQHWKKSQLACQ